MSKKAKNKGGRPKEPVSSKVDFRQVAMLCEKGFTDVELAKFYGVTEKTINNWKLDKEFLTVLKESKALCDEKVVRSLFERACGYEHKADKIFCSDGKIITQEYIERYPPDPTSMIFWLKNRQPDKWRDKQDVEHSGSINTVSDTTNFSIKKRGAK